MSYPTLEVRWFLQGRIPEAIDQFKQYFHQGTIVSPVEEREDWYLQLPQNDDLGIKLREGKVEIKKRVADRGMYQFAEQVAGRVEEWMKWSFASEVENQIFLEQNFKQEWIAVKKSRQQKTYHILDQKITEVIDPTCPTEQGCNLEIATLEMQKQTWFSLGFETFGERDRLQETFEQIVHHVLENSQFPPLQAEHSFSYPGWLSALVRKQF
jgi:hypothetical protein